MGSNLAAYEPRRDFLNAVDRCIIASFSVPSKSFSHSSINSSAYSSESVDLNVLSIKLCGTPSRMATFFASSCEIPLTRSRIVLDVRSGMRANQNNNVSYP